MENDKWFFSDWLPVLRIAKSRVTGDKCRLYVVGCLIVLLFIALPAAAGGNDVTDDSVTVTTHDKVKVKKKNRLYEFVKKFNRIDTTYIEPQHYNYTMMLQNTTTYEVYYLSSKSGQEVTFAPRPSFKVGPYFGWRWVFLGYTFDINHLSNSNRRKEIDISLYSSQIGIDLFYRNTGDDYKIRSVVYGNEKIRPKNLSFSGIEVGIKGVNVYYIFNHHKFSYPAAFSQSTMQKKSCGSPLIGIGYTNHSLKLDYDKFREVIADIAHDYDKEKVDSGLMFNRVDYDDYSISGGYAYNYVFARNCLLAASLSVAVAYKKTIGEMEDRKLRLRDFEFSNFNLDAIGRFGIVYNNMKWYCGANVILHGYSYHKSQFSTNNIFGSLNIYFGMNFGKMKKYRRKKNEDS